MNVMLFIFDDFELITCTGLYLSTVSMENNELSLM